MKSGASDALVVNKDLVHPNFRVIQHFPYSFFRGDVILHFLDEELPKHILVEVGGGPDFIVLKEGIGEENGELFCVLSTDGVEPIW